METEICVCQIYLHDFTVYVHLPKEAEVLGGTNVVGADVTCTGGDELAVSEDDSTGIYDVTIATVDEYSSEENTEVTVPTESVT